jgi:hypothetical protein
MELLYITIKEGNASSGVQKNAASAAPGAVFFRELNRAKTSGKL